MGGGDLTPNSIINSQPEGLIGTNVGVSVLGGVAMETGLPLNFHRRVWCGRCA